MCLRKEEYVTCIYLPKVRSLLKIGFFKVHCYKKNQTTFSMDDISRKICVEKISFLSWNTTFLLVQILRTKGQLISKCLYEVIVWTKIPTKNLIISALIGPGQKLSKKMLAFWSKQWFHKDILRLTDLYKMYEISVK